MTSRFLNLQNRINVLRTVLTDENESIINLVDGAFRNSKGDLRTAVLEIKQELSESEDEEQKQKASELMPKVSLAYSVADLAEDNEAVVKAIASNIFSAT